MSTLEVQVQQGTDDAYRSLGGDLWVLAATSNRIGNITGTAQYGSGMRFASITIPPTSTITAAYLKLIAYRDDSVNYCKCRITAEDVDNAPTFADDKVAFDARYVNSIAPQVAWNDLPAWTQETQYQSPDFSSIIQQVIDRPGWQSGNAIVIFWQDFADRSDADARRRAYSFESDSGKAPILHIEYSYTPADHVILDGRYGIANLNVNRVYVVGSDDEGNPVYGLATNQDEIDIIGQRLDINVMLSIPTESQAQSVAQAILDKHRLTGKPGFITIPPNCGVELWDVIQLTDELCNQNADNYRVLGVRFEYEPKRSRYEHKLILGAP